MRNYGIDDVSKRVNLAAKCINIASVNVATYAAVVARASYESVRGRHHVVIFVIFFAKIVLNSSVKHP